MATLNDLLDDIKTNYDVVELIDRGTTAGDKIHEYDLWYRENNIIKFKRLHIYIASDGTAEWYGENPIPVTPSPTFTSKVKTKVTNIISSNTSIKHIKIEDIDPELERATVVVYIDDGSGNIIEKKAAIFKAADGSLDYLLL